jgi:hypothetical protein
MAFSLHLRHTHFIIILIGSKMGEQHFSIWPNDSTAIRVQTAENAGNRREKEENSLGESLRSPRSLRLKKLFAVDSPNRAQIIRLHADSGRLRSADG